jgi:hypothetical protein
MNHQSELFLAMAAVGLGLVAAGFFLRPSAAFGLISLAAAVLAGLGAWYSWADAAALPWAVGYAAVAVMTAISAVRHFAARPR